MGLFGKKYLENSSFNNALVVALSESVKRWGRMPKEGEIIAIFHELVKDKKLTDAQARSIRACASLLQMQSACEEMILLVTNFRKEMPQGQSESYNKIIDFLSRNGIIINDDSAEFLRKLGLDS